ncbi:MAG TPA: glutathione synthase, partial [Sphingomonadales bacterium]|nr:glutathione synthase [Sphingomonadales bacterium]
MAKLTVAIQMDPLSGINIDADSSFALIEEAERRGHTVYHYEPRHLTFLDGKVTAEVRPVTVRRKVGDHFTLGASEKVDLAKMDVVLL